MLTRIAGLFSRGVLRRFASPAGRAGSVSALAALMFIPALALAGFSIDYGMALRTRARLNGAADTAALAAVAMAQALTIANQPAATVISQGQAAGASAFAANAGPAAAYLKQPVSVGLVKTGRSYVSTISFSAAWPTIFGNVVKTSQINMGDSATATVTMPSYLDFYLLLDVSGSMGIPSTATGQNSLAAINPDQKYYYPGGCTFACHFAPAMCPNNPPTNQSIACVGYDLSRTNGGATRVANDYCPQPETSACIQLRLDAVAYATQQLLQAAQLAETLPNQFRVGLYPFIVHMQPYSPITSTLSTISTAATGLPGLLDTGSGTNVAGQLGSGGTHFDNALSEMNSAITTFGDGSSASSPLPFVFLVTDGAQDNQYYLNSGGWTGSNHATTLNTANCALLRNNGVTVSVLYVPYAPIQNVNTSFAGDEDDYANWNIPSIPPALQACASPGFFFTANTPADITAAMKAMFAESMRISRLTN